ncbi:hypothetical protein ZWY2020_048780 [Hordeum vulgare]|nr:hypothetical protein ZWY2020_048780 [Hordeum vulgare]
MELGSYGGGPTTIKLHKYWTGKEDRDPICNTDDFISNKNFLPHMEHIIANGSTDPPATILRVMPEDEDSWFLSIKLSIDPPHSMEASSDSTRAGAIGSSNQGNHMWHWPSIPKFVHSYSGALFVIHVSCEDNDNKESRLCGKDEQKLAPSALM